MARATLEVTTVEGVMSTRVEMGTRRISHCDKVKDRDDNDEMGLRWGCTYGEPHSRTDQRASLLLYRAACGSNQPHWAVNTQPWFCSSSDTRLSSVHVLHGWRLTGGTK